MNLSTVARIKVVLGSPSADIDALLTPLLLGVSARVEQYLGRAVETRERIETLSLEQGQQICSLSAFPVDLAETFEVYNDASRQFDDDSLVDAECFDIDEERGLLYLDRFVPITGHRVMRVVYTGGMGAVDGTDGETSEEFIAAYPDIAYAVDLQCAEMYRRRNHPGSTSTSFQGGGNSYEGPVKLLPIVTSILDPHRRAFGR